MQERTNLLIAAAISSLFLFIGIVVLPDYAQNWDESSHFFRGQAYLNFFLTGNKNYSNLPKFKIYRQQDNTLFFQPLDKQKKEIVRRSMYQYDGLGFDYWNRIGGAGHPPLSDIFSALFNFIFFQKLGLINDVDSYHLYSIFLSATLVGVIYLWVKKEYGRFSAFISSISLALYPLFLGESHFNIKDPPETVFYSLTVITFYEAIARKSNKWMFFSSIFSGFALATKFNIVFVPFIILPWLASVLIINKNKIKQYLSLMPSTIIYPIIILVIFFAAWPCLWSTPLENFKNVIIYYKEIGTNSNFDPRYLWYFGINTYAVQRILFSTPVVILILFSSGILYSLRHLFKKSHSSLLIVLWFFIPILRVSLFQTNIYGGVRQIMEYVPAMAILSGIGAKYIVSLFHCFIIGKFRSNQIIMKQLNNRRIKLAFQLLIILSFVPITCKLIYLHPNEGLYFNPLIGGFKGASNKNFLDANYDLGNAYKQAIIWINKNAEKGAKLALFSGLGSDIPGIQLRGDIEFSNLYRSGFERKGEYILGLMENVNLDSYGDPFIYYYYNDFMIPVYEIKIEGVPIVKIWKNDKLYSKPQYKEQEKILNTTYKLIDNTLVVSLPEPAALTKISVLFDKKFCTKTKDGSIELALNSDDWEVIDNDLQIGGFYYLYYNYKSKKEFDIATEYTYPFVAQKASKVRFTDNSQESCLRNNVTGVEVFGLKQ